METRGGSLNKVSNRRANNAWQRPQRQTSQRAGRPNTVWQCRKFSRAGLQLSCNTDIIRPLATVAFRDTHYCKRHRGTDRRCNCPL